MSDFTHLHLHTKYSVRDALNDPKKLAQRALEFGMKACAITDHGYMFGVPQFYIDFKEAGLKPILGCEVYVTENHMVQSPHRWHLILLAQNNVGYGNLVKLCSIGGTEGFYYRPRIDFALLRQYSEGLICTSACIGGEIPQAILNGNMQLAKDVAKRYAKCFPHRFYLELQSNGLEKQQVVNNALLEIAESTKLPLVATNDCHYLDKEDSIIHEVFLCVGTKYTMSSPNRFVYGTDELYFKSGEQMEKDFASYPKEAISNTALIAEQCDVELELGTRHIFPVPPLPEGLTAEAVFQKSAEDGLEQRLSEHPELNRELYVSRLEREMGVIIPKGFASYFLVVQEAVMWAKTQKIPVGPGRGSSVGSLVSWALGITELDPIRYGLSFERFLNPERKGLPDIDIDICQRQRGDVIQHLKDTYGEDHVAQLLALSNMKAKEAVISVGKALDVPLWQRKKISKPIPKIIPDEWAGAESKLAKAIEEIDELSRTYKENELNQAFLDICIKLEGLPRHTSIHASGVLISDKPISDYVPVFLSKKNNCITSQLEGPTAEKVGLVKFDFLGLKTLTLINDTLEIIKSVGKEAPDLKTLPLDDEAVFTLYSTGNTDGIFQVESVGMKQYLQKLRPSCFEDIAAMLALYRPGPIKSGMVDKFINRKNGTEAITYPDESLRACLEDTYGTIIYQEQIMQIAQVFAGYSASEADTFRRAVSKKKKKEIEAAREPFIEKSVQRGRDKKLAVELFEQIEQFASYGFNKSHSVAYAFVSYQTAYLKAHFPVEFMAALLTSVAGDRDKLTKYISASKEMGVPVAPPSINISSTNFIPVGEKIVFSLAAIKGVGEKAARNILEERTRGAFTSLENFRQRILKSFVNKRKLCALIHAGALDEFGQTRQTCAAIAQGEKNPSCSEYDMERLLQLEEQSLGCYITMHPTQLYPSLRQILGVQSVDYDDAQINAVVVLAKEAKQIVTKHGKEMAFLTVEDSSGQREIVVFSNLYASVKNLLVKGRLLLIQACRNDKDSFTAQNIRDFHRAVTEYTEIIDFSISLSSLTMSRIQKLADILSEHKGITPFGVSVKTKSHGFLRLRTEFRVCLSEEFIGQIKVL